MENFVFQNRTKIIFGRDSDSEVGAEVKAYADKVLLHYGSSRIKDSGLFSRVSESLKAAGVSFVELGGVEPNPRLSLVKEGITMCRENGIEFILAVGGGSVIDSAKAIAIGVPYEGDVWDFYDGKAAPQKALDVATILTIPAAGSEASPASVITNTDGDLKRGAASELLRPVFSILNPELTFSLPPYQTACGAADILVHVFERYFTNTTNVELTDRLCEAVMKTVIENVTVCLSDPLNYNARAEVMWAGTVAHNDLVGTGRAQDWGSHQIEHEISGIYDVAHGAGLAAVVPAWMKTVYKTNIARFVQFASRVWNVEINFQDQEKTALEGIKRTEQFFSSIGLPVTLGEMDIDDKRLEEMADKCTDGGKGCAGNFVKIDKNGVLEILKTAL
ncbi:iron-containing alcohol dehydrogenase [Chitinispirillales bacterium ANBcel5]|uniref:iron-containing alcohol dehydrogenase n=1 Tax=Cellulosispirillum alkaliphilum TaxID=3039283 RepID=UPI002A4E810B|nr:iron-containing alcohol dehydrogenase [Chitinispirillales bacterium ANBcel5]